MGWLPSVTVDPVTESVPPVIAKLELVIVTVDPVTMVGLVRVTELPVTVPILFDPAGNDPEMVEVVTFRILNPVFEIVSEELRIVAATVDPVTLKDEFTTWMVLAAIEKFPVM